MQSVNLPFDLWDVNQSIASEYLKELIIWGVSLRTVLSELKCDWEELVTLMKATEITQRERVLFRNLLCLWAVKYVEMTRGVNHVRPGAE